MPTFSDTTAHQHPLDQGPEDDLQAHRKLEHDRRMPHVHPRSIDHVLGEHEEHSRPVREHRTSLFLPDRRATGSGSGRSACSQHYIIYTCYIDYWIIYLKSTEIPTR